MGIEGYLALVGIFPAEIRSSGVGLATAASRLGSAIGTFLLPLIVSVRSTIHITMADWYFSYRNYSFNCFGARNKEFNS
ncbi:hypothetical protein [Peribacillus aracenensis]|uniref:hypothetical protein n=1 Tax=Peribacillus aracenensis TaxID=2976708 RepID=UPI0021A80206|nr:hypothetical protein [Peribacillus sp. BBB004]